MEDSSQGQHPSSPSASGSSLAWTLVIILTMLLIAAVLIIFSLLPGQQSSSPPPPVVPLLQSDPTPTPAGALINLNRKFTFPIYLDPGVKAGEIDFTIQKIERTREVMVGGNKATAAPGRELIILDIEVESREKFAASVITRNYLRLKVNGQDKYLAPDFHPDPLDLQPLSVRPVRLAFSIAQSDRDLVLQVGDIDGPKELIPLDL